MTTSGTFCAFSQRKGEKGMVDTRKRMLEKTKKINDSGETEEMPLLTCCENEEPLPHYSRHQINGNA